MKFNLFLVMLIMLIIVVEVHSLQNYLGIFTFSSLSSTDIALGTIGTANIYNSSPLSVLSNPAKLGYHQGLSFGLLDVFGTNCDMISYNESMEKSYSNASYLSYGCKGIGLMIPVINKLDKWGYACHACDMIPENGNDIQPDTASCFALGINIYELLNNFNNKKNAFIKHEFSFGFSFTKIYSDFSAITGGDKKLIAKSLTTDFGFIYSYSPINKLNSKYFQTDFNAGITLINSNKSKFEFISSDLTMYEVFVPFGTNIGVTSKILIKTESLKTMGINNYPMNLFAKNLLSLTIVYDMQYGNFNHVEIYDKEYGCGVEVSLLDIFSLRFGKYWNNHSSIIRDTFGYGINLNFKDIFQFQFNQVKNISDLLDSPYSIQGDINDYMIKMDFLKIIKYVFPKLD
ncbi:MAG: hypothetical protein K8S23_14255 [Candidatus Cloacimonetes bacterium]|nr:hypothetical protein [Candidatus Cloacimonadota bacterium]